MWGEICYSAETGRILSGSDTGKEWVSSALQQNKSIIVTGVVTSEGGEPIIGATVQVKGTSTGVITDIDGRYKLRYLMEIQFYRFHLLATSHKK